MEVKLQILLVNEITLVQCMHISYAIMHALSHVCACFVIAIKRWDSTKSMRVLLRDHMVPEQSKRRIAEEMATLASEHTSRRGGKCPGAGRKNQADKGNDVRVRISEAHHLRWNEVKTLKKLPSDNTVARYLLVLAAEFDEQAEGNAP